MKEKGQRLHALDALRGLCLISMIGYHGMWNLVYLFGVSADWYRGLPGYLWQQSICWTFILLSGFCFSMGRNPAKRGAMIFGGGILVSLVTHLLMPVSRITFGILTCTGSCVLLVSLLRPLLKKIPSGIGAAVSFALFLLLKECGSGTAVFGLVELPRGLYRNMLTTWLGFPMGGFYSADYFPLLPWLLLFLTGFFLYGIFHSRGLDTRLFARGQFPVLNFLGRHSLLVYLLHQPVVYGIFVVIDRLIP